MRIKAFGTDFETLPDAEQFSRRLETLIAEQFKGHGFHMKQSSLSLTNENTLTNAAQNRREWMQLQLSRAYSSLQSGMVRPEGPLLAEYEGADGLVFCGAVVRKETGGAKGTRYAFNALEVVLVIGAAFAGGGGGGSPMIAESPEGCALNVTLVEGRTGVILWRNHVEVDSLEGRNLNAAVSQLFDDFPER